LLLTNKSGYSKREEKKHSFITRRQSVQASTTAKDTYMFKTNCSGRIRHRPREELHPRLRLHPQRRFHPRRDSPRPRTTTQAEGFPPRRRTPAPSLGPRRPRPLNFGQGSFIFVGKTVSLVDPLQIHIVVGSKHGKGPPNAVMQRLAESAAHMAAQGPQVTLGGAPRGDVVKTKDLAEGRDSFGHGRAVGFLLLSRLGKCLGGLVEGRLELCKQPKQNSSNTS
jgi:hypothetical protein